MTQANRADDVLLSDHRHRYNAANSTRADVHDSVRAELVQLGSPLDIGDPDEASSPDSSAGHGARRHRLGPLPPPVLELLWRVAVVGDRVDERPVETIDASVRGAAQSDGIADDGVKYGLYFCLGLADRPEDLGGGGLPIERLRQVVIAG